MNKLIELWVSITKGREIEEFESDVQELYDYTMNLQKENERVNKTNMKLLSKLDNYDHIVDERDELKSQLKGTTHCYDEVEHKQLEEQVNHLDVVNCRLRKNIEKLKKELQKANDTLDTHNELIEHLKKELKDTNLILIDYQDLEIRNKEYKTQQKEFIKYLEDEKFLYEINTQGYSMNLIENVLAKYKEIIGEK